jgi:CHASE2 domain-containing sensor protein/predicted Ser/Thr protein kinase
MLAVALAATAAGLAVRAGGGLQWLESRTIDARFSLRGQHEAPPGVVVVGIDNNTLASLPRFPFSRTFYAQALERLHAAGARVVVFDVAFDRPTSTGADLALFEAARRAAPVIFATSLINSSGDTEVFGGNSNLASIGAKAAATDLLPDSDGVIRHLLDQVHRLPSIAAAAADTVLGHPVSGHQMQDGWIDFRGPPNTARRLSFLQVLHGDFDTGAVRGKVVLIGATAPALQDLHTTSVGGPISGAEVQAQALSTVLAGFPLQSAAAPISVLLIILFAMIVPLAGLRVGALASGLFGLALFCLWSLATQLAFNRGVVLDFTGPVTSLLVGTGGTVAVTGWSERRERRRLRELFAANAAAVVEQVLVHPVSGSLAPTAIIAGYRIEETVGHGGMGVVYRATQTGLDRTVAIKLIATERAADPIYRERFKQESRLAASIDHANVIPVYEAGEDDGLLFIAMRLVEGIDLAQLIGYSGPLNATRALRILEQLAGALDAAHARGLVHRDVKPANVLLTAEEPEHVYLTDFGVAKSVGAGAAQTRAEELVGTLDYVAPEQIQGKPASASVDIYALTGLFHYCLTGEVPYPREEASAKLWAHLNAPPPTPSKHAQALPEQIDAVIARGMQKDPALRYQTAAELARAAAHALGLVSRLTTPKAPTPALRAPGDTTDATIASR